MILPLFYVALGILLFFYFLLKNNSNYWESRGVPNEKPFLFFGSFYKVATQKEHIFNRICAIYTNFQGLPYAGIYIFTRPTLVVRSPDLLKQILVKDFDKFADRKVASNESVDPIAFHTLFSSRGATWKALRAKISPVFTSGKMRLMMPLMQECGKNLVDCLAKKSGETLDISRLTKKYAVDLISSCAFGINAYCLKDGNSEILQVATKLLDFNSPFRGFSVLCFFFAERLVDIFRLTFVDKASADYLFKVFKQTLIEREENKIERNDLIDLLNNLKKSEKITDEYKFDDKKMASQAISFFSAGNETMSLTIAFTIYELALNQDVQKKLRREITKSLEKHNAFTYEAIQEIKYLDMVINESLRKYPLTSFLNREATEDYVIEETGFKIEKGTAIMVPICGLHYDPEYFPEPEKYDPERFNESNLIKPYTYLPFGEGPRNCIGQRFGLLAAKVALVNAVKNFTFERTPATQVPLKLFPKSIFMRSAGGIHVKVVKV